MKLLPTLAFALFALMTSGSAQAETAIVATVGSPAPDFSATDTKGTAVKLSDFKGKTVVLEWTNHECPFVRKHYDTNNMQKTQAAATADGVVWISIVSSAADKEGHVTPEEANQIVEKEKASPSHVILDEKGETGHLYGAKTTPHMFVVDKDGKLAYAGAIDDNSSYDPKTVEGAKNYVLAAIADLKAGKAVETSSTNPYGCGVKY